MRLIAGLGCAGDSLKSAGGEAANAQVCKTCIRGFNSRPALQIPYSAIEFTRC
jgi:hypothetical protein